MSLTQSVDALVDRAFHVRTEEDAKKNTGWLLQGAHDYLRQKGEDAAYNWQLALVKLSLPLVLLAECVAMGAIWLLAATYYIVALVPWLAWWLFQERSER